LNPGRGQAGNEPGGVTRRSSRQLPRLWQHRNTDSQMRLSGRDSCSRGLSRPRRRYCWGLRRGYGRHGLGLRHRSDGKGRRFDALPTDQIPTRGHKAREGGDAEKHPKPLQLWHAVNVRRLTWLAPKCQRSIPRIFASGHLYIRVGTVVRTSPGAEESY
jgi:hypothetical protein